MTPRILEVRQNVLKKNDELARALRTRFLVAGVLTTNLVSSPGSGKTAFLERTMTELVKAGHHLAALVGDLETDNDALRLARSGAPTRQIQTHNCCHLEADMIANNLEGWELEELEFLFIENVGNLVCPASFDLGENLRVVLMAVTEGEDKPLKYPKLFNSADVAVITKIDLAAPCEFERDLAHANIQAIRPGITILETSAKTGEGMSQWVDYLLAQKQSLQAGVPRKTP